MSSAPERLDAARFCTHCGTQLQPSAKFCSKCGGTTTATAQLRQTLEFGPVEKKLEALVELNRNPSADLSAVQPLLEAMAHRGDKTQMCLYAIRALILLGSIKDSTIDALMGFIGEPQFWLDDDDHIIRFPWVPRDLPKPEEDLFNLSTRADGGLTRQIEGNFLYAVIETLSHAKGSEKAAAILKRFLDSFEGGESRVMVIYAMGALGDDCNKPILEYYRDNMGSIPEGRAAKLVLENFGTLPVFDLIRKHAASYGKPAPVAKSGCFVATAAFGDVNSYQVMTLRSFRDEVLLHRRIGRLAVRVYYYVSPTIAEHIEHSPSRRAVTRATLEWIIRLLPAELQTRNRPVK